jgi:hypothetical protein
MENKIKNPQHDLYPQHHVSDEVCNGCQMCDDYKYYTNNNLDPQTHNLHVTTINISDEFTISIYTHIDEPIDVSLCYTEIDEKQYLLSEIFSTWTKVQQL